jgi:hypothetical protein
MKKGLLAIALVLLCAVAAIAGTLTFVTKATLTVGSMNYQYDALIDLSTLHKENGYPTVNTYARFDTPIEADGYKNIKWWKNIFQADCQNNKKRLIYIGYLDPNGKLIVEDPMPNAPWEEFHPDEVNYLYRPYVCPASK